MLQTLVATHRTPTHNARTSRSRAQTHPSVPCDSPVFAQHAGSEAVKGQCGHGLRFAPGGPLGGHTGWQVVRTRGRTLCSNSVCSTSAAGEPRCASLENPSYSLRGSTQRLNHCKTRSAHSPRQILFDQFPSDLDVPSDLLAYSRSGDPSKPEGSRENYFAGYGRQVHRPPAAADTLPCSERQRGRPVPQA